MKKIFLQGKTRFALAALLLLGVGYLGLVLFLGTSSPFMLVQGTSMEPTFHSGDLLLNKSVSTTEIEVGDVIAFNVPSDIQERLLLSAIAVHRVVGIEGDQDQRVFITQGDNSDVDPFEVPSSDVRSVVVKNLGPIGWPILFLINRSAFIFNVFLLVGLPILTFLIILLAALWLLPHEKGEGPAPEPVVTEEPASAGIEEALGGLASAVAEYGIHLQSHTEIIKNMGGATRQLEQAAERQNEVLTDLAEVVKELKGQGKQADDELKPQTPSGPARDAQKMPWEKASGNSRNGQQKMVYKYVALTAVDKKVKGCINVPDEAAGQQLLERAGLRPVSLRLAGWAARKFWSRS